jgi:uncharacterized protein (TIGR03000 family)
MFSRWLARVASPALAALVVTALPAKAQPPLVGPGSLGDPFGPNSYIYSPGFAGPGGILNYHGYYGPGYVGDLWYWPNVHWPARSWYMTYNAGPGGYRVFYPGGYGRSYFWSLREGIVPWEEAPLRPAEDRADWAFPRDATVTRGNRERDSLDSEDLPYLRGRPEPSTALINVRVPVADAEVSIDGQRMIQTGLSRRFVSPPLAPRRNYVYDLRARWTQNGKKFDEVRRVTVRAGATVNVSFGGAK